MTRRRSRRVLAAAGGIAAVAVLGFWGLSRPDPLPAAVLPEHRPDVANGERLYHAGNCFACHLPPEGTADPSLPSGGTPFATPIGTFYPQNITPHPRSGIGAWSAIDFVNAMSRGLAPDGRHYFPAFPYVAYRAMPVTDLLDLRAYLMSLPAVDVAHPPHDVPQLGLARRGVGLWKLLAFRQAPAPVPSAGSAALRHGAYLVNGPGHCGECHTPRSLLMIEDPSRHMGGGPHPGGEGKVPSLRGLLAREKYEDVDHLAAALQHGEALGFENLSSGGMGRIQENLGKLPEEDLRAIAEYLLSLE